MAMCATLFEWKKTVLVANKARAIKVTMRVKAVCFYYITVAATYITAGGCPSKIILDCIYRPCF